MATFIPVVTLIFQGIVAFLFLGSFWIGYRNLREFKKSSTANTLKTIIDDYQKLINDNTFNCYTKELVDWKTKLADTDFSPTLFYYNTFNHISRIGQFYDHVGLLVRDEIIDFNILFELLPFPFKFWEDTSEFRGIMQDVTYVDFWLHFQYLRERYVEVQSMRKPPKRKAEVLKRVRHHRRAGKKERRMDYRSTDRLTRTRLSSTNGTSGCTHNPIKTPVSIFSHPDD